MISRTDTIPHVAVVIPCLDEERTIGKVVADMKAALPGAEIFVFDNGSTDRTAEIARAGGATVVPSPRRGKGNVIRHMANVVQADAYVLLDGDDTYPASEAPQLLRRFLDDRVDMLVATRLDSHAPSAFRVFHKIGNRVIARIISLLFRAPVTDVLSGYRILSSRFVRLAHLRAEGFEIETEMTLQALAKGLSVLEVPISYGNRPTGSHSKLDTVSDGLLIFKCIFLLFKDYKPFVFFTAVAALLAHTVVGRWKCAGTRFLPLRVRVSRTPRDPRVGARAARGCQFRSRSAARHHLPVSPGDDRAVEALDARIARVERHFEAIPLFDVVDQAERYNRYLLDQVLAFAGSARSVIDFGAGTGRLSASLLAHGFDVTCVEPDPELRGRLAERGLSSVSDLNDLGDRSFDYAVSLNVLEHCPDDARVAQGLHRHLAPGGRCLIYVPAFPLLWTANDTLVGHQRRYRRSDLSRLFRNAGFVVDDLRYVDSLGFLAALAYRLIGRSDGQITAASVRLYDRLVLPPSLLLDRALHRLAGKNLMLRARRR